MRPHALNYIDQCDVELFEKIRSTVTSLPDKIEFGTEDDGKDVVLTCHILARAIARCFNLKYIDGYYYEGFEHSWLITDSGNIIDVYPIAMIGGPIMIESGFVRISNFYIEKDLSFRSLDRMSVKRAVNVLCDIIQNQ